MSATCWWGCYPLGVNEVEQDLLLPRSVTVTSTETV
jgi:hypothetical protein